MFQTLKLNSQRRSAWLFLVFTCIFLESLALWFQHVMLLKPCALCIYERCALFGIMFAGIAGTVLPKTGLRYVALTIWVFSAFIGVLLTYEHTLIQMNPSIFYTCDFIARFPEWLPLGKWFPDVFVATGDCSVRQWSLLGIEMPQWLSGIFIAYLVFAVLIVLAQFTKTRKIFGN